MTKDFVLINLNESIEPEPCDFNLFEILESCEEIAQCLSKYEKYEGIDFDGRMQICLNILKGFNEKTKDENTEDIYLISDYIEENHERIEEMTRNAYEGQG